MRDAPPKNYLSCGGAGSNPASKVIPVFYFQVFLTMLRKTMQCIRISSNITRLAAKWWQLLGPGCRRALFGHSCTALPARSQRRLQSEPAQQRAQTITAFLEIYHVTQWACGPAPGPGRRDASLPTKLTVQSVVAARSLGTQTTVETANCRD